MSRPGTVLEGLRGSSRRGSKQAAQLSKVHRANGVSAVQLADGSVAVETCPEVMVVGVDVLVAVNLMLDFGAGNVNVLVCVYVSKEMCALWRSCRDACIVGASEDDCACYEQRT
jgi:hypothetical protein